MTKITLEERILNATKACCERWGASKTTADDIAAAAGISRATLYRVFPGGKDVVFDALRVRELEEFFDRLRAGLEGATSLADVVVTAVSSATRELRADQHLAVMMASQPGDALGELTVAGLPRIVRMATLTLAPFVSPFLSSAEGRRLIDVMARLTISYFLAPSDDVDLGDREQARAFLSPLIHALTRPATLEALA